MLKSDRSNDPEGAIHSVPEAAWMEEMGREASRFHVIGMWVAIIFDPLFVITDYINIPGAWTQLLVIRLGVALSAFIALRLNRSGKISTYLMVAVTFLLIALQNCYTYYLIGPEQLLGHNLNFLALFMGAGLFLIWNYKYSIVIFIISLVTTALFISMNRQLNIDSFFVEGGLLLLASAAFMVLLVNARYRLRRAEIKSRLALQQSLVTTSNQNKVIENINQELTVKAEDLNSANARIATMNDQLLAHNGQLESQVASRTERLTKANREMNRLVYSLSHDFKTPVTNMRGLLQLANLSDYDDLPEIRRHMGVSINQMEELLRNLRNYSVYWDDAEIKKERLDLQRIVDVVFTKLSYMHDNEVDVVADQGHWHVISDGDRIMTILYCLLDNAIRFRKDQERATITVKTEKIQKGLWLSVTDQGKGIDRELLPKVFDIFYRADEKSKGAGLGLYICKGIVEQLEGEIKISSELDMGTTVSVLIPDSA